MLGLKMCGTKGWWGWGAPLHPVGQDLRSQLMGSGQSFIFISDFLKRLTIASV